MTNLKKPKLLNLAETASELNDVMTIGEMCNNDPIYQKHEHSFLMLACNNRWGKCHSFHFAIEENGTKSQTTSLCLVRAIYKYKYHRIQIRNGILLIHTDTIQHLCKSSFHAYNNTVSVDAMFTILSEDNGALLHRTPHIYLSSMFVTHTHTHTPWHDSSHWHTLTQMRSHTHTRARNRFDIRNWTNFIDLRPPHTDTYIGAHRPKQQK